MTEQDTGTVIEGTLRAEDLIPAFFAELFSRNAQGADEIIHRPEYFPITLRLSALSDVPAEMREDAGSLLEDLEDALNAVAPEGTYFGAHPDDGACYGFWPVEFLD